MVVGVLELARRLSRRPNVTIAAALTTAAAGALALFTGSRSAHAEDATADRAELAERCSVRLSMALLGESPDEDLLANPDPQSEVDAMIKTPTFRQRFASFINSELSGTPSDSASNDPVYHLAHYVLTQNKPWSELFVGKYSVAPSTSGMNVTVDPNGVGYFRTPTWRRKFAGNDEEGTMLVAAFRIVQNTTGLTLTPSVGNAGEDRSLEGRRAPACKGCHFDAWYALDTVANLLPKREGEGDNMTFKAPTAGPQKLLGKTIADDKAFIQELVASDAWKFNQCRRVFRFLYGRDENKCEAKVFDACVDALTEKKTIQAAVATVAKDPSFCTN